MSDTPRTDEAVQWPDEAIDMVPAHFARNLERENAALRALMADAIALLEARHVTDKVPAMKSLRDRLERIPPPSTRTE